MRNRGAAILIDNDLIGLIKRAKDGMVYYVFPGGGIEKGETPEEATKREVFEELGVIVEVIDLVGTVQYNGTQYYYLAEIIDGEFGTGKGEEFTDQNRERGSYEPMWVPLINCETLVIKPKEIIEIVLKRIKQDSSEHS